jgi:hypothetical protein
MQRKLSGALDQKTETVIVDQGCTTRGTEFIVRFDYTGFKVHVCSKRVCWTAPPDRLVIDGAVTSHSATGSRHSYSGPHYVPTREQPTQICADTSARGPDRDIGSRGWQKVTISATHQQRITPDMMTRFAVSCAREGAS